MPRDHLTIEKVARTGALIMVIVDVLVGVYKPFRKPSNRSSGR